MAARLSTIPAQYDDHRGVYYRDSYGTWINCEHCDIATRRRRKHTDQQLAASFRRLHKKAAVGGVTYVPKHAAEVSR